MANDIITQAKKHSLNPRQFKFCQEYLASFNATQAYQKAYNRSDDACAVDGHNLLRIPKVQDTLKALSVKNDAQKPPDASYVLNKLRLALEADLIKLFRDDDSRTLKDVHDWPDDIKPIIHGFEVKETWTRENGETIKTGEIHKVKLIDPLKAIELAMKHLNLLDPQTEGALVDALMTIHDSLQARKAERKKLTVSKVQDVEAISVKLDEHQG